MSIFADVLERLQFQIFLESLEQSRQIGTSVKKIQDVFQKGGNIEQRERERMRETNFSLWRMQMFPAFRERGRNCSEQFLYWNKFLTQIFPVIHDSTCSHREGNWELHLSAIRRALPLCFALNRVNYKRGLPLYYKDAVALKERFLNMHARFFMGDFTVKYTKRSASALTVDQALEKSGIIGIIKRKEVVLK